MPSPALDPAFLARPIAHRALHGPGRPENSRAAVAAAINAGYGIEIDLQRAADGTPMVFHDVDLGRLTGTRGALGARTAAELRRIPLLGSDDEGIPTFAEILALVAGRVPLLVEVKDQDGALGPAVGPLERAVAQALAGYAGPVAVMSFNPESVRALAEAAPEVPRGLTTCAFGAASWGHVPAARRARLRAIPDAETLGLAFVSHDARDLRNRRIAALKAAGLPILTWTIRSPAQAAATRPMADQITFEHFLPS